MSQLVREIGSREAIEDWRNVLDDAIAGRHTAIRRTSKRIAVVVGAEDYERMTQPEGAEAPKTYEQLDAERRAALVAALTSAIRQAVPNTLEQARVASDVLAAVLSDAP